MNDNKKSLQGPSSDRSVIKCQSCQNFNRSGTRPETDSAHASQCPTNQFSFRFVPWSTITRDAAIHALQHKQKDVAWLIRHSYRWCLSRATWAPLSITPRHSGQVVGATSLMTTDCRMCRARCQCCWQYYYGCVVMNLLSIFFSGLHCPTKKDNHEFRYLDSRRETGA